MRIISLSMAVLLSVAEASTQAPPPEGVLVPPYEPVPDRPIIQSTLIVKGSILRIEKLSELEQTPEYKAYVESRFEGWPEPHRSGMWDFNLFPFKVEQVINATSEDAARLVGTTIDVYIPDGIDVSWEPLKGSTDHILFLEPYVHRYGGNVSPYSQAGSAYVLPPNALNRSALREAPADDPCPGAAFTSGGKYILDFSTDIEERKQFSSTALGTTTPPEGNIYKPYLAIWGLGSMAAVKRNELENSPWTCEHVVSYVSAPGAIEAAVKDLSQ